MNMTWSTIENSEWQSLYSKKGSIGFVIANSRN